MTDRRRGLGRGLGALIPSARPDEDAPAGVATPGAPGWQGGRGEPGLTVVGGTATQHPAAAEPGSGAPDTSPDPLAPDAPGARYAELPLGAITPNPRQPRQVFDEEALAELVHSIREIGLLQPVVVRQLTGGDDARFELVMGERRWRAAQDAGLQTIPAIIRETADTDLLRDALLENLHRAQLNPLEEAAAYDQLLRDFGCTQDELAERIGRSRPQISNTLRLLRLPPSVQRRLAAGVLSAGHARAILGVAEPAAQERLAQRVVAEGLSVRSVEEIVAVGGPDGADRQVTSRTRRPVDPEVGEVADRLSDRFDTRVRIEVGRNRGKVVIEFASLDDLSRIVGIIEAGAPTAGPE